MESAASSDLALEVDNVSKTYRNGTTAVHTASFAVSRGEVLGLLGANGAGKTTTIKMLCGLVKPTSGRARVYGNDVEAHRGAAMRRIGAVLEGSRNVYWNLSAWENLVYFGRLKGLRKQSFTDRAESLLLSLGLWERRHDLVGKFSRGMQQKVAIAAALIADPPVVLLDEPTLGLDVASARTVKEWIGELSTSGNKTVLLTTHQLDVAQELCDRIAIMRAGRIVLDLPLPELLDRAGPQDYYEIVVRTAGTFLAPDGFTTGATETDRHVVLRGPVSAPAELHRALDAIRAQEADIVSVVPHRPDLEEIFLRIFEGAEIHG